MRSIWSFGMIVNFAALFSDEDAFRRKFEFPRVKLRQRLTGSSSSRYVLLFEIKLFMTLPVIEAY